MLSYHGRTFYKLASPENRTFDHIAQGEIIATKATIVSAEPRMFATDIKRSYEFFREKLGV
jgi:hypothetical protein